MGDWENGKMTAKNISVRDTQTAAAATDESVVLGAFWFGAMVGVCVALICFWFW